MYVGIDVDIDIDYCIKIAERGAFLGFDSFGKEYFIDKKDRGSMGLFATDLERINAIKELIGRGFLSRILMTTDIVFKTSLHAYGGRGYDHVLNHISPMMEEHGVGKEQIQTILKKNPLSLLS